MTKAFYKSVIIVCALTLFGASAHVHTAHAADAWFDTSFSSRRKITFSNGSSSQDLINFPVPLQLNSSRIDYTKTQGSGQDIRFTDSNGTTTLQYEIEKWDESGTSTVWVKVPQINGTSTNDYVYMYYGSSTAASNATTSGVWDANYAGVWHLTESPSSTAPQANDSTVNNLDGTSNGSMTFSQLISGQMGGAWDVDGTDDYVSIPNSALLRPTSTLTVEVWFSVVNNETVSYLGLGDILSTSSLSYGLRQQGDPLLSANMNTSSGTLNLNYSTAAHLNSGFNHLALTFESSSFLKLYRNGSLVSSTAIGNGTTLLYPTTTLVFARDPGGGARFSGVLDDVKISNSVRSADWLFATYKSGNDQYASLSSEESVPTIQFSATSSSGSEGTATATLTLVLSSTSTQSITVQYSIAASSTATGGGTDYTLASGTSTITAGNTTTSIAIPIVDDALIESNETIVIIISTSTNAVLGSSAQHVYTITENDYPIINFAAATSSESEASSSVYFQVVLSASAATGSVDFAAQSSSTATGSGTDFTLATGTLLFCCSQTSTFQLVTINNDTLDENNETIVIQLQNPVNLTLGTSTQHIMTIVDNDSPPTVSFSLATSSVSESTATATVIVALSASSSFNTTVQYSVLASSTATGSGTDYTLANGTSTITAGSTTTSIDISIVNDSNIENDETVVLGLANPVSSTLGSTIQHVITLTSDDTPTVNLTVASSSVSEGSSTLTVGLSLSSLAITTGTIQYSVLASSTATGSGADYTLANGTSTFGIGTSTAIISVTITNDTLDENDETIVIGLTTPTNLTLGTTTQHVGTMTDNDSPPTISFSLATSSNSEASTSVSILVSLNASSGLVTSVQYSALASSTATGSGTDFTLASGTSTISAGNTTTSISLTIVNDSTPESSETVVLGLATPTNASLGSTAQHIYTIEDNDDGTAPGISAVATAAGVTTSTITWDTDEAGSSQVEYGIVSGSLIASTTEADTSPRVTSHNVSLSNLVSCTTYYFRVRSLDAASNIATGTESSFGTSAGCTGGATIVSVTGAQVATSTGATITNTNLTLTIPSGYSTTTTTFQAKSFNSSAVTTSAPLPASYSLLGSYIYNIKALTGVGTSISSFASSVTIMIAYTEENVASLEESSLRIFRYTGSSWAELTGCAVDGVANTVTCGATNLGDIALLGQTRSAPSSGGGGGGGGSAGSSAPGSASGSKSGEQTSTTNQNQTQKTEQQGKQNTETAATSQVLPPNPSNSLPLLDFAKTLPLNGFFGYNFSRNLEPGMEGEDVRVLQKLLNTFGFKIAESGPGSPGNETAIFGASTQKQLKTFQEAFRKEILDPVGLKAGTGSLRENTRKIVNNLLQTLEQLHIAARIPEGTSLAEYLMKAPIEDIIYSTFPRNLEPGMEGEDVRTLQKLLNALGFKIAESGVGSPGKETSLFGASTQRQLKLFQEAFHKEILDPIGLKAGTGSLRENTRQIINNQLANIRKAKAPKIDDSASLAGHLKKLPLSEFAWYEFPRNLEPGMEGEDIRKLQMLLNILGFKVVPSGFYDIRTQQELKLFQEAFHKEILDPIGLKAGTGSLRTNTRTIINSALRSRHSEPPSSEVEKYEEVISDEDVEQEEEYQWLDYAADEEDPNNNWPTSQLSAYFESFPLDEFKGFFFVRDLELGSYGEDVKKLQILLNTLGFMIAESGPESPGEETLHFTNATQKQLALLEEVFADEFFKNTEDWNAFGKLKGNPRRVLNKFLSELKSDTPIAPIYNEEKPEEIPDDTPKESATSTQSENKNTKEDTKEDKSVTSALEKFLAKVAPQDLVQTQFLRDLEPGTKGEDVRKLQKLLNASGFTIAESGPGSAGRETTIFGKATQKQLKLFEEAFRKDLLLPHNREGGALRLGTDTRELINEALRKAINTSVPRDGALSLSSSSIIEEVITTSSLTLIRAGGYTFTRTLKPGSKGEDVKKLQELLNDLGFIIAKNGPGSFGNETNFFGVLTSVQLTRFQEQFRTDILTPLGLSKGTGTFGPYSRKVINGVLQRN